MRNFSYATLQVMIVDDNELFRKIARNLFKKCGCKEANISDAQNGEEALQLFEKKHGFDVIYMDHQMPKLTGDVATQQIRQYEKEHGLSKAFIFTCSATYQGVFAGADAMVQKPFKYKSFQQLFATYLNSIEEKETKPVSTPLSASKQGLFSPTSAVIGTSDEPLHKHPEPGNHSDH